MESLMTKSSDGENGVDEAVDDAPEFCQKIEKRKVSH